MEHLLQKSKCSIFHNIFKYMIFQRRQKALLWGKGLRVCNRKIIFLFPNQNICFGYSKERSQRDVSFEHQKHMLILWVRKYLQFYAEFLCLSKPVNTCISVLTVVRKFSVYSL